MRGVSERGDEGGGVKTVKFFLPQYAAHAVADLEKVAADSLCLTAQYREAAAGVASLLRSAVHVCLPSNGEIYRSNDPILFMPDEDECLSFSGNLPAPVTSFEYSWSKDLNANDALRRGVTVRAPRRITLIIDSRQLSDLRSPPEGFAFYAQMFSVFYDELQKRWLLHEHSLTLAMPLVCQRETGTTRWCALSAGAISNITFERIHSGPRLRNVFSDFLSDVTAAAQACHALRAGASLYEQQEQSSSRRRKFEKLGVGGFTYHVLTLPHAGGGRTGEGGTHSSPRYHVRRAHIRKLPSGALTFVRQCFVGDPARGQVEKNYKMTRAALKEQSDD